MLKSEMGKLPRQDDFRNFCLGDEIDKNYSSMQKIMA